MNALCYKIVFSKRLGTLVAVGEHTVGQGKAAGTGVRTAVFPSSSAASADNFVGLLKAAFASVALTFVTVGYATAAGPAANTLPTGYSVNSGNVAISSTSSATNAAMIIQQTTDKASINWQSFSIGSGAAVNVQQNNANSVLLNRVVGNDPSQIFGKLTANGQVILINPNGVVFGKGGSVTASAFTASTFGMTDADFMAGKHKFSRNGSTAGVTVEEGASINTTGYVALIGASVDNQGVITTKGGAVVLASGEQVGLPSELTDNISVPLSNKVRLELQPSTINAMVANSGTITTEGGQVLMQAAAVSDAVASITHTGTIDTTGEQGGAVTLQADHGIIKATGTIKANSKNAKNKGADIVIGRYDKIDPVTGKKTTVLAKATDVSGARLESQGGFVETSGDWLATNETRVKAKDWLLDPVNITIASSASGSAYSDPNGTGGSYDYNPTTTSTINASDISNSLNEGTNVKISTGTTNANGSADGNISVDADITKNTGTTAKLTLEANNGITINRTISGTSGSGNLDVELIANGTATSGNHNSQGITFNGAGVINTNGNVKITSTSKFTNSWNYQRSALAMAAGSQIIGKDLDFKLTAAPTAPNRVFGIYAENNTTLQATGGNLLIDATVQGAGTFVTGGTTYSAAGIYLGSGTGAKIQVIATGNVTLKTDATDPTNVNTTYGISIRDTKVSAGGNITIDAQVKDASVAAITTGNGGSGLGADFVAGGDVSITSDKGTINISGLTVADGGLQGKKVTINNGTGATGTNGGIAISGTGNGNITATDAIEIIGKSVNGHAVQISNNVNGKSINIQGDASGNGRGIGGIGALNAKGGGVTVIGTSMNEVGANINNSITATGDIDVTGRSKNWHGLFSNGTINSSAGKITFWGQNDNGSGLGMGGGGSMTAKGDIAVTGKSNGYFGIGGNGAITSTEGKVTLVGTSTQSIGIVLNNKITAKNGTVELTGTGGNNSGISITGGSTVTPVGIEAASYNLNGTSTSSNGVYLDGTASFKSTDTTQESVIDGKGSRGVYIYRGALTIDSGNGKATMKGSAGGVGLGSVEGPTINTKGDVTIGSHDSNARLAIQRAKISAEGKLALLGQSGGDGITMQDGSGDNVAIVGSNGAQITIDGKSTGSGTGVLMRLNGNVAHTVTSNGAGGSIKITGTSETGTGVNTDVAKITGNDGANVVITGTSGTSSNASGSGTGVSIANAITTNGTSANPEANGSISITGTSFGSGHGVFLNTNGGAGAVTANDSFVSITGEAKASNSGLGTYLTGNVKGKSVNITGNAMGSTQGIYTAGSVESTNGDIKILGTSEKGNGTQVQGIIDAKGKIELLGESKGTAAHGLIIQNSIIATGNITVTGKTSAQDNNVRAVTLTSLNASTHGSLKADGQAININSDTLLINTSSTVDTGTTGSVSIKTTSGNSIALGSEDVMDATPSKRTLGLNQNELNSVKAKSLVIGDTSSTGKITVETAITTTISSGDLTLQTGRDIQFKQGMTVGGSTAAKKLTLNAGGEVTQTTATSVIKAAELQLVGGNGTYMLNNQSNVIGKISGSAKKITFNNSGELKVGSETETLDAKEGITLLTGDGNLDIQNKITNTDSGDVILAAGYGHTAGSGLGNNILTNADATVSNGERSIRLYTGSTTGTGKLANLHNSLDKLDLEAGVTGTDTKQNTMTGTSFLAAQSIDNGANVQAFFREKVAFNTTFTAPADVVKTYGAIGTKDEDTQLADTVKSALKGVNSGNAEVTTNNNNTFKIKNSTLIDNMTFDGGMALSNAGFSTSKHLKASDTTYKSSKMTTSNSAYTLGDVAAETVKVKVNKADLTIGGLEATNKEYDGNAIAQVNANNMTKTGLVEGDVVTRKSTSTGSFRNADNTANDKNVARAIDGTVQLKTVALTNQYDGMDLGNYNLIDQTSTTAKITPKALTVSGITAENKIYDGNADAVTRTANASKAGIIGSDEVIVNSVGKFRNATNTANDKNVALSNSGFETAKTVALTNTYTGTDVGNYTISDQSTTTATITQKPLAASYIAKDKVFDGSAAADVTGTVAPITGDKVNVLHTTANFDSPDIGTAKTVTVSGISLSGADAANYKVDSIANTGNTAKAKASITAVPPKPPVPVVPTDSTSRVKIPVGSSNPFALASAEDLADDTCTANSIENCYCEESTSNQGVDICYEPKTGAKGSVR